MTAIIINKYHINNNNKDKIRQIATSEHTPGDTVSLQTFSLEDYDTNTGKIDAEL